MGFLIGLSVGKSLRDWSAWSQQGTSNGRRGQNTLPFCLLGMLQPWMKLLLNKVSKLLFLTCFFYSFGNSLMEPQELTLEAKEYKGCLNAEIRGELISPGPFHFSFYPFLKTKSKDLSSKFTSYKCADPPEGRDHSLIFTSPISSISHVCEDYQHWREILSWYLEIVH